MSKLQAHFRRPAASLAVLSLGITLAARVAFGDGGSSASVRVSVFDAMAANMEASTVTFRETSVNLPGSHLRRDSSAYSVEASIAPPFPLMRAGLDGPLAGRYMLVAIPKFLVRRSDGVGSNPVRTPGYMPSVALYYSPWDTLAGGRQGRGTIDLEDYWYLSFTLMHYSNGQTGDALNPGGQSLNNVDGSFSLWSASAAVHFHTDWPWVPEYKALQVEYLYNKEGVLDALYPDWVFSLAMNTREYRHGNGRGYAGRSRLLMDLDWRPRNKNSMSDALKPVPLSAAVTAVHAPRWGSRIPGVFLDFAVFGRLYAGYDYYSMNFDREIYRIDFGLMFGPFSGLSGMSETNAP